MEDSRGSGRRTWQDYARQRRQNMSEEQRQQHLARRRASYRESIRRGKQIDTSSGPTNMATPLQDITNIPPQQYYISDTHNNTGAGSSNIPNDSNMDEQLAITGRGIYTFRAQGSIYHSIGGFHPDQGTRPRFLQLYIYDTDHELQNRMLENTQLHETLVFKLQQLLHRYNPFLHVFRQLAQRSDVHECSLVIRERPANQPQYSLPTASQVAAIIVGDDVETMIRGRDIKVQTHAGTLRRIQEFVGYYDPLQYPLLFPFGTHGWDINTRSQSGGKVSCRTYNSYMLQIRPDDHSTVLQAGRLLQQYVVDNYVKIKIGKLRWVRNRQKKLRAKLYQGLQDALHTRETNAENVGRKRTILPSSFIGSRRDMTQRYEDGMAIVLKEGKPDIFLIMTCNPSWTEITLELNPVQTPQDRPDLTTRIFRAKFEQLKEDVITKGVLGKVKSYIYVTEFQKRGLPHVHMLLILENNDKLIDPEHYDSLVRAEIPSKEVEPHLHDAVLKHMIHGPCGTLDQSSPCMKNGKCKRNYPKEFAVETRRGDDSYPQYRRRFDTPVQINQNVTVDNRWVVPYNPWLLLKYDCHINVEICSSIKSIKYLYKYCYKGPDRVAMEVHNSSNVDEVQQFVDARWIAAPEACWRIFKFNLYRMYPSVERLQIHLPNQHQVSFYDHQTIPEILNDDYFSRTMLTEFFALNREEDQQSRHLLYREIPEYYTWHNKEKEWRRCKTQRRSIGRIYTVSPSEGEKFYLRILLSNVRGPISWDDLLIVNGIQYSSFKQSAQHRGLLESDSSIRESLTHENDNDNSIPRVIQEELSVEVPREDLCSITRLNNDQSKAFKCIMNTIDRRESGVFFVDGPGGSGKIFLYRAIIAELRNKGHIVLVTASSGIAATLLPGGRTAHSRFKIPINAEPSSICNISKQSDLAKLIRQTTAIIWDEAPMANKESVQSLDRTLRDILANDMPFGGKVMVMGGDFRQVLPVVPKGSKSQMISASIVKSQLWASTKILHLRQNMRSSNDHVFAEYLMRIGDGIEPTIHEDFVRIQANMAIPWEGETSLHKLIEEIFPNLQSHGWDASYMVERAILTPKNHDVQQLNDIIINQFPGEERNLVSFDEVEGDANNLYQQEYLNSVSTGGFPPHVLKFFKAQESIDKEMYEELLKIFSQHKKDSSNTDPYFGLPLKKKICR
ncbi:uncharacterized protein [Arachis hypogaea]|uniref:uncharacterized protein n=1 Tax=Arachis hypogaea TaxID=3818 RepID=UPI0010FC5B3B|nr:uncharacterized protein LOC112705119 [Arachis hypogaea]